MALRDELIEEDCFTLERGTPTLTIEQEGEQTMVPWSSFCHAIWNDQHIQLHFAEWLVNIMGNNLTELWTEIQQQCVVSISTSVDPQQIGCFIRALEINPVKQEGEEDSEEDA